MLIRYSVCPGFYYSWAAGSNSWLQFADLCDRAVRRIGCFRSWAFGKGRRPWKQPFWST